LKAVYAGRPGGSLKSAAAQLERISRRQAFVETAYRASLLAVEVPKTFRAILVFVAEVQPGDMAQVVVEQGVDPVPAGGNSPPGTCVSRIYVGVP